MLNLGNVLSLLLMQAKIKMFGNSPNDNSGQSLTSSYLNFDVRVDALFCAHQGLTSAARASIKASITFYTGMDQSLILDEPNGVGL